MQTNFNENEMDIFSRKMFRFFNNYERKNQKNEFLVALVVLEVFGFFNIQKYYEIFKVNNDLATKIENLKEKIKSMSEKNLNYDKKEVDDLNKELKRLKEQLATNFFNSISIKLEKEKRDIFYFFVGDLDKNEKKVSLSIILDIANRIIKTLDYPQFVDYFFRDLNNHVIDNYFKDIKFNDSINRLASKILFNQYTEDSFCNSNKLKNNNISQIEINKLMDGNFDDSVNDSSKKVYNYKDVLDICSGSGNFLLNAVNLVKNSNLKLNVYGIEKNELYCNLSKVRLLSLGIDTKNIKCGDGLFDIQSYFYDENSLNKTGKLFDFIFSEPPIAKRVPEEYIYLILPSLSPELSKLLFRDSNKKYISENRIANINISFESLFIVTMLNNLKKFGKGAIIVSNSFLSKEADKKVRKYLLEKGKIEGIIKLPKTSNNASIETLLLILSNNENNKVKFLDLTVPTKNIDVIENFSEYDIFDIMNLYCSDKDCDNFFIRANEDLLKCDSLDFKRLLAKEYPGQELKCFADVIRGSQASALKKETENNTKKYKLLNVRDIGKFELDYDFLDELNVDEKTIIDDKFFLKEKDIVISSKYSINMSDLKVLFVENLKDKNILVSSNMLIIRSKDKKFYPEIIRAFFNTKSAKEQIKNLSTGSMLINLTSSSLEKIKINISENELENKATMISSIEDKIKNKEKELKQILKEIEQLDKELLEYSEKIFKKEN